MQNFKIHAMSRSKQVWNKAGLPIVFMGLFASLPIIIASGLSFVSLIFPFIFSLLYFIIYVNHKGTSFISYENGVLKIYKNGNSFEFFEKEFTIRKYTIKSVEYGVKIMSKTSYVYLDYADFGKEEYSLVFGRINRLGNKITASENFYGGGLPDDELDRSRYVKY